MVIKEDKLPQSEFLQTFSDIVPIQKILEKCNSVKDLHPDTIIYLLYTIKDDYILRNYENIRRALETVSLSKHLRSILETENQRFVMLLLLNNNILDYTLNDSNKDINDPCFTELMHLMSFLFDYISKSIQDKSQFLKGVKIDISKIFKLIEGGIKLNDPTPAINLAYTAIKFNSNYAVYFGERFKKLKFAKEELKNENIKILISCAQNCQNLENYSKIIEEFMHEIRFVRWNSKKYEYECLNALLIPAVQYASDFKGITVPYQFFKFIGYILENYDVFSELFATAFQLATTSCSKSIDINLTRKVFDKLRDIIELIRKSRQDDRVKLLGIIYELVNKWNEVSNRKFKKIPISRTDYDDLIKLAKDNEQIITGLFERGLYF